MEIKYFPEGDVLRVKLNNKPLNFGEWTSYGSVDYSDDRELCRVSFILASLGIDVDAAPEEVREEVAEYLRDNDLVPTPFEKWAYTAPGGKQTA